MHQNVATTSHGGKSDTLNALRSEQSKIDPAYKWEQRRIRETIVNRDKLHREQACASEADQPLPAKIRILNTWEALEIPEGSNRKTHRKACISTEGVTIATWNYRNTWAAIETGTNTWHCLGTTHLAKQTYLWTT